MIVVPHLEAMSPTAAQRLREVTRHFEAAARSGVDFMPRIVAADLPAVQPIAMEYPETADGRAVQTAIAAFVLWHQYHPTEVLWACDTYGVFGPGVDPTIAPSDNPEATEALTLHYASARGIWLAALPYGRDDSGQPVWREPFGWLAVPEERQNPVQLAILVAVGGGVPLPDGMTQALASTSPGELAALYGIYVGGFA